MQTASMYERIIYRIFKPHAVELESLPTFGFRHPRPIKNDFPEFEICPMESGMKALLRLKEVRWADNVDDQYFVDWLFIYYVDFTTNSKSDEKL